MMIRLIGEIGCNHQGSMDRAKELIDMFSPFVWGIKFQKRDPDLFRDMTYPHPHPEHSFGTTYGQHRLALEFTMFQHQELKEYCESRGVVYGCSVWDEESAYEIMNLSPAFMKIPSARNTEWGLCKILRREYDGEVMVSLGMIDGRELEEIGHYWQGRNNTVMMACASCYPCDWREIPLGDLEWLRRCGYETGLSGHHRGRMADMIAVSMGATVIERHITFSRVAKGTDHALSNLPHDMNILWASLEDVREAMKRRTAILPCEEEYVRKLK